MSSAMYLDDIPEAMRYAPPIRKPHVQAAVDITRKMIYGQYREREVMPSAGTDPVSSTEARPASATPADRIAELMRELTYGEMMEFAAALWKVAAADGAEVTLETLPEILWRWANVSRCSQISTD